MWVAKLSGEKEEFQPEKIRLTCLRAGASLELANQIVRKIEQIVYRGISTKKIARLIFRYLEKNEPLAATRYNLKDAIARLGPTGFDFERLIKEILEAYDYKVEMPEILPGLCVSHEVDLVARKRECYMVECKYHNFSGLYCGIKDALYTYARFLDLKDGFLKKRCPIKFDQPFLVCNTKFSQEAVQYSFCKKIKLLSWKFPQNNGLRELIEKKGLYPITILRSINKSAQKGLARQGIMLCQNLIRKSPHDLEKITGLKGEKLKDLIVEAGAVVRIRI